MAKAERCTGVFQPDARISLLNDTSEEILEGIAEGEKIILTNQDKLQDGMKVKVTET